MEPTSNGTYPTPTADIIIIVQVLAQFSIVEHRFYGDDSIVVLRYRTFYTQYPIRWYTCVHTRTHHKLKKKSTPHNSHLPLITGNHISQFHIPFVLMHFPRHTCPDTYVPKGPYHNVPILRGFQGSMVVLAFVAPVGTGWP